MQVPCAVASVKEDKANAPEAHHTQSRVYFAGHSHRIVNDRQAVGSHGWHDEPWHNPSNLGVGVGVQCFCARTGSCVLRRNERLLTDRVHYHSARLFPDGAPTVLHWPDRRERGRERTREQGRRRDRGRARETEDGE